MRDVEQPIGQTWCMAPTRQSVIFLAMHKGGSSFIANVLAKAIDQEIVGMQAMNIGNQVDDDGRSFDELAIPPVGTAVVRVYPREYDQLVEKTPSQNGRLNDIKMIVLQRDPRDAAISRYFANAFSHSPPKGNEENFLARRKQLVESGPHNGMLRMAKPTMREFAHLHRIIVARPEALVTTYEAMVTDYRGWLADIGRHVGWTTAEQEALFAGTKDNLEFPIIGNPNVHVRRVTPGNWRRYDRPKLRRTFDELGEELMKQSGYTWPTTT